jgi:hypothetical protein
MQHELLQAANALHLDGDPWGSTWQVLASFVGLVFSTGNEAPVSFPFSDLQVWRVLGRHGVEML